jgi:uncharacterized membrane protein
MLEHYLRIGILVLVSVVAIVTLMHYICARRSGVSESDYIIQQAGGAAKLLKENQRTWAAAYVFIFGPIAFLLIPKLKPLVLLEAITLPLGLILLYAANKIKRIGEAAMRADADSESR